MKPSLLTIALTFTSVVLSPSILAAEPTPAGGAPAPPAEPNYTLVFSDDFSTNPNSNGKWTVFRRQGNPNEEGYWDPASATWYLTRQQANLAIAAFANYELTAKIWKVNFKYRVDNGPKGADGFVFMFYKDKSAYGTPDSGTYMGFQTRNRDGSDNPVSGYGLQFDTYQYVGCDPLQTNYIAIIQDVVCQSAQIYRPFTEIDDNVWHSVEFRFTNGRLVAMVDGTTLQGFGLFSPDYTYTGIGFGAGTGSSVSNQIIDNFQIWVGESAK
jgi:hypothetical protein